MKNRFLITALSAIMAVGMISCGNPAEPEDYELTIDNVDQCISSIGQYKGLKINITRDTLTDDAIDYYMDFFFEKQAETITDWPAAEGDTVVIDYIGSLPDDTDKAMYGKDQKILIGGQNSIRGFEEALRGVKKGDEVTVSISFPDDYQDPDFAGRDCNFILQVKSVIPAISDESVAALNSDVYSDENEYRVFVYYTLKEYADSDYRSRLVQEVLKKAGAGSVFQPIPAGLIQRAEDVITDRYKEVAEGYNLDVPAYLEYCDTSLEAEATAYARQQILIYKIAKEEGLNGDDSEAIFEKVSDFIAENTN